MKLSGIAIVNTKQYLHLINKYYTHVQKALD